MDCTPAIAIFGAGNVATHLAKALDRVACVRQVLSRDICHAQALATQLKDCQPISSAADLDLGCDYYIFAVSDDSIAPLAASLPKLHGIAVHTSGSVDMNVLSAASDRYGVLYPLQTFSKAVSVDMRQVPLFTEANDAVSLRSIDALASSISDTVRHANSEQRAQLHVAAVFACNFANHLWALSSDILEGAGYDFSVLAPLLRATLDKAAAVTPKQAQTGPARRGDRGIIAKHLSMLSGSESDIYALLSNSILRYYEQN